MKTKLILTSVLLISLVILAGPSVHAHGKHGMVQDAKEHFVVHMEDSIPGSFEVTQAHSIIDPQQVDKKREIKPIIPYPRKS